MCLQVVVDLNAAPLDDEPEWYYLSSHEDALPPHMVSTTPNSHTHIHTFFFMYSYTQKLLLLIFFLERMNDATHVGVVK